MFKKILPYLLIIFLSFWAWAPLTKSGFFTFHDNQQVVRLYEMDKSLLSGQFPVRWVSDLGFGYGYPLFNFYPPLTYYLGEVIRLGLNTGFIEATKLVWLIAFIGSGFGMYLLSKEFFGKISGVVSALFYIYAPYHAVDAYVRGAQAELFSFVWLPLILLFSFKTVRDAGVKNALMTGIFMGLLMLTHPLVFLPFFGLFCIWHLAFIFGLKARKLLSNLILFIVAAATGLGLSASFWLPEIFEKTYTLTDKFLTTGLASYKIHFVCPAQLWNSPWGFGGSISGCIDGLSFMLGKLYWTVLIVSLLVIIYLCFKRTKNKQIILLLLTSFSLAVVSLLMTTNLTEIIWDKFPPLWYLQFPWRFLEYFVVFSSLLAGAIIFFLQGKLRLLVAALVIGALIVIEGKYFQPQTYLPVATDEKKLTAEEIKWNVSLSSFEYMSNDVQTHLIPSGGYAPNINPNQVGNPAYQLSTGDWQESGFHFTSDRIFLSGSTSGGASIIFPVSYFPGWTATVNNLPAAIIRTPPMSLISLNIPPGTSQITLAFTNTPIRNLANILSLLSVLTLALIFYATRTKYRRS